MTSRFTSDAELRAQKKKLQVVPEGDIRFNAHLLWSDLPNSHSPLNHDGVGYQNRDTENIHVSKSCIMSVGKAVVCLWS